MTFESKDLENSHSREMDTKKDTNINIKSSPKSTKLVRTVYISSALAALGGFVCGYDSGAVTGIMVMVPFINSYSELADENTYVYYSGLCFALMLMTAAIGAFVSGPICDKIGRKWSIVMGAYIFALGILFEIIGQKFGLLLAGRLVAGFGNGLITNAVPLYHSEIAPPDIRGRLVTLFTVMASFGTVCGYFITFGTSYLTSQWAWRAPWIVQLVIAVFLGSFVIQLPYSPRWLFDIGQERESLEVLAKLRELPTDDPAVVAEYVEIKEQISAEKSLGNRTYIELFYRKNLKATLIAFFIGIATSFTGINAILYYGPSIFMDAGLSDVSTSIAASGGTAIVSFGATIVSFYLIDIWGRKKLFILGAILMGIAMFIVGAMFQGYSYFDADGYVIMDNVGARTVIIICIYVFMGSFNLTWGVASYVYPAEIFNMRNRAKGLGLTYGLNWAFSILVTYCMPLFMASTLSGVYFFFGSCCIAITIVVFFIPETRNITLEAMEGAKKSILSLQDRIGFGAEIIPSYRKQDNACVGIVSIYCGWWMFVCCQSDHHLNDSTRHNTSTQFGLNL
ncbi:hypothetical protein PPL_07483 [Heterostelium album PN500]|uniref:Major facilitator superfamily (MFS) profile domain-containing protein n=1 Tax=Heterostelium pallidum (strain ATCC 26659 / Pp 5 / PN500) TaxID=670386 RepID=D3BG32_HETP5|nr:hypothetical protein PPL_07483 [Heterostelium album PN500]EFA79624.1 hypothetical protein PPL_07483 [Heterostelium album PN500]|eukprot:XP_020431745.1 hypothetical protein PPL_07483 [Heterostelium album PN500]